MPVDDPHAGMEMKPQLQPRGNVAKEEDPKPSHQLYKLQIKSTQSTRQTLCLLLLLLLLLLSRFSRVRLCATP